MSSQKHLLAVLMCVFFLSGIAWAQVTTGTISGTVSDSTGAVIPGATITLRNVETGISRTVTTDAAGRYTAPRLSLGGYEVTAETTGFQSVVRSGIELTIGREATVDFTLQVGSVTERITVTGEAPLVTTTNATISLVVGEKEISELPLNGRNFTDLTAIQPGAIFVTTVATNIQDGAARKISITGARNTQTGYLLDGVETMHVGQNSAPSSVLGFALGIESIREFNVMTSNFGAQYGRASGGVVNSVTRSGTNEFHGSAFEFMRNEALDANDYFVPAGRPKIPLKQHQFGASFGGPIQKDRTFLFLNYEGVRQRKGISDFTAVLDKDAQEGLITKNVADQAVVDANLGFKLGDPLPTGLWKISSKAYDAVVPKGNDYRPMNQWLARYMRLAVQGTSERLGNGRQRYVASRMKPGGENFGMFRIDRTLSDKDSLFGRLSMNRSYASTPHMGYVGYSGTVSDWTGTVVPGASPAENHSGAYYFAALPYTRIVSPEVINTFSIGFTRTFLASSETFPADAVKDPVITCFPGSPLCVSPVVSGTGLSSDALLKAEVDNPLRLLGNTFIYQDQVLYNKGRHSISVGAEVKRYQMNEFQNGWGSGSFTWVGGYPNWYAGKPFALLGPLPISQDPLIPADFYRGYRQTYGGLYFQDDLKVFPNLTLNMGLRWEFMTSPTEVNNKIAAIVNPYLDQKFTYGKLFNVVSALKGLSPRFGFAWTPAGAAGKTSVRGGFGVFQEWPLSYVYTLSFYIIPLTDRVTIDNPTLPFPVKGLVPGDPKFADSRQPRVNAFNDPIPYNYNFNLGIERQLGESWVVKANYIGTRNKHLISTINPIMPTPKKDQNGRWYIPANGVRLNPAWGSIQYFAANGSAWYNGLQSSLERRFAAGLGFRIIYTWSKNMDNIQAISPASGSQSPGGTAVGNHLDMKGDNALSSLHSGRSFQTNFNFELPVGTGKRFGTNWSGWLNHVLGDWQLNGIVNFRDGLPSTVTASARCSGNIVGPSRPDLKPGASNNPVIPGKRDFRAEQPYFDVTAFTNPPSCFSAASTDDPSKRGYWGNVGRNTLRIPGVVGTDMSIFKTFQVGEGKALQFRAEFFNIINRANFALSPAALNGPRTFQTDSSGKVVIDPATGYPVPGGARPNGQYVSPPGVISSLAAFTTMRQIQLALKFEF